MIFFFDNLDPKSIDNLSITLYMRAVIQRVKQASVTVDSRITGQIERGLLVLVGICPEDTPEDCEKLAAKLTKLRLWPDEQDAPWRKSVADIGGKVLCVSQFTLYASIQKGTKPDFHAAAKGDGAAELYNKVKQLVAQSMPNGTDDVADGEFGAMMDVSLVNDGPVTIQYDTKISRNGK